jgi:hypothetical protein
VVAGVGERRSGAPYDVPLVSKLAALLVGVGFLAAWANAAPDTGGHGTRYQVSVFSDSFTSGSAQGGVGPNGWPALVRKTLGDENIDIDLHHAADCGAGYATVGNYGAAFGDQVSTVFGIACDLAVFFGSPTTG